MNSRRLSGRYNLDDAPHKKKIKKIVTDGKQTRKV
jgi:hypothetical protein